MKKTKVAAFLMAGLLLQGCKIGGSSTFPPEQNAIYISRKGEIYTALTESYDPASGYYDQSEFRAMAEEEAATYNAEYPASQENQQPPVTITDCTLENGSARIVYQYASGEDLCRFTEMFQDEVNQAQALSVFLTEEASEALTTEAPWIDAKKNSQVTAQEVAKQNKLPMVSVTGHVTVQTEGKILYYNGDVSLKDEYTAEILEGNAYLVFK